MLSNHIKQILKEETRYNYIKKIVKHLLQNIKGGAPTPRIDDIISTYALTKNDILYLKKLELESIKNLKGRVFNVLDYEGEVNIGGYDFKFTIYDMNSEEGYVNITDSSEMLEVEVVVYLNGATVTLLHNGEVLSLEDAVIDDHIGWEISSEISDIIKDIIFKEEIILKALGADLSIEKDFSWQ